MAQQVKNPPAMQEIQETWVQFLGWEVLLKKEMATCSSILAWKTPWTEEPGAWRATVQRVEKSWKKLSTQPWQSKYFK